MKNFREAYNGSLETWSGGCGAQHSADYVNQIEEAIKHADYSLKRMAEQNANKSIDYLKGDIAEIWHAETLKVDAARLSDSSVFANVPRDRSPMDIIYGNNETSINAQLKYYKTGEDTAKAISQPKYDDLNKIVPKDQLDQVKETAKKLALKNSESRPEQADRYRHTFETADDRLRVASSESKPLSEEDAKQLAKDLKDGNFNPDKFDLTTESIIKWSDIAKQSGEAALNAVLIGLILKAGPALASYLILNIKKGEIDTDELKRIGMNAFNDSILNGLRAGIASFLTASCRSGALGESFKMISPVAIGAAVTLSINVMKHSIALSNGQISGSDFAELCLRDTVIVTFSLLGATAGQILIPIPVLGSLIGNFVGGIIGNIVYQTGNQLIMCVAIDKGWTFLDFVTQDYTVPEEVLKRAGYDLFASKSFSNQSFSTKSFTSQSFSTNSIIITPLKRGLISVRTIGYL